MREHIIQVDEKGKKLKSTEYISVLFMINKHFDKFPCKKVKIKPTLWHYRRVSGYASILKMLNNF